MSENAITRRSFLAGSAGVAAIAAGAGAGFTSFGSWEKAYAKPPAAPEVDQVKTLCDGCGNQCGLTAWLREGELWRVSGDPNHPNCGGVLCGRGQGFTSIAYSEDRITAPLKKNDQGKFEEISWEQAYTEIAEKVNATDPAELAVFQSRGHEQFFVKRFATALGSANYFTDAAVHDADISAVIEAISGAYPAPSVEGSKYIVMLDKSTYDGFRPAEATEFSHRLDEAGDSKVVLVDPRMTSFGRMVDEWLPIRPGTELAFLLGVAGVLVREGHYDKEFVAAHANGFDEFAKAVSSYSIDWASDLTGIPDDKIHEVAMGLYNNMPHCFVDLPWAGTFGSGYKNSADTVRMVYLLNALLGNFNQEGGWIFGSTPYVADAMLDPSVVKPVEAPQASPLGADKAPLSGSSCLAAIDEMRRGAVKTAFFVETNPMRDYPSAKAVKEAIDSLDCMVVCDVMLTETAELADYVLPLDTYLEQGDTINTVAGKVSVASMRNQAIDRIHPETRTLDELFTELANRCEIGDYFTFSLEDYNRAWAKAAKVSYDDLAKYGTVTISGSDVQYGSFPYLRTASGKIDFASDKFEKAGLTRVPAWVEPLDSTNEHLLRMLVGEEVVQSHTYTTDAPMLFEVAKMYNLDRAWVNTETAADLGIADGDEVELSTSEGSVKTQVKVTSRIHPEAVWVPTHYGITAEKMTEAKGFGFAPKQLIPLALEPGTGAGMMNEVNVSLKKVGA